MHCSQVIKLSSRSLMKKTTKKLCSSSLVYFVRKYASSRPLFASYKWNIDKIRLAACQDRRELTPKIWARRRERTVYSFSNEMEVAKLAARPNLEVRFVSCESAIKRWLSSELEEAVFPLTHELFMSKHHTVTLNVSTCYKRRAPWAKW